MAQVDTDTGAAILHRYPIKVKQINDVTDNDSDKTLTVPDDRMWELIHLRYELTTTATAGTRTPEVRITDGTNNLFVVVGPTVDQSLSSTMHLGPGMARDVSNGQLEGPARILLPAGYTIQVIDVAAIDAAADDLILRALVLEYNF